MMGSTIKENKKYRQGYVVTETIVDGDVWKITEEYKDEQGNIVYVYEYYPTAGQNMKAYNERMNPKPQTNKKFKGKRR